MTEIENFKTGIPTNDDAEIINIEPGENLENKKRVSFKVSHKVSDSFKSYNGPKVNLIVLNPPHLVEAKTFSDSSYHCA